MIDRSSTVSARHEAGDRNKQNGRAILGPISWLALVICLAAALPADAADLFFLPSTSQVGVGNTFDLQVGISGLGDYSAPSLGAFDLTVNYSPTIFSFDSMKSFGDPTLGDQLNLSGFGTLSGDNSTAGSTEVYEVSLDDVSTLNSMQPSSFILATLEFQAIGAGSGLFSLSSPLLSDAIANSITVDSVGTASITAVDAIAAPEPSAMIPGIFILAAILIPLQCRSRRNKPAGATPNRP